MAHFAQSGVDEGESCADCVECGETGGFVAVFRVVVNHQCATVHVEREGWGLRVWCEAVVQAKRGVGFLADEGCALGDRFVEECGEGHGDDVLKVSLLRTFAAAGSNSGREAFGDVSVPGGGWAVALEAGA